MLMVRGVCLVLVVVGLGAGVGCGGRGRRSPPTGCARSVEEFCSLPVHCPPTWDEVQAGMLVCSISADGRDERYEISDCGNYHRLIYRGIDNVSFYFDAASGQLVAVTASPYTAGECYAGPDGGFEYPGCDFPDGAVSVDCNPDVR